MIIKEVFNICDNCGYEWTEDCEEEFCPECGAEIFGSIISYKELTEDDYIMQKFEERYDDMKVGIE